jgi:hypothetical protein
MTKIRSGPNGVFRFLLGGALAAGMVACGGGDPLNNPPLVTNSTGTSGQTLSFDYFQHCINPIFLAKLPDPVNGGATSNTCAASGCHDNVSGRGAAFRIVPGAQIVAVGTNTPDVIRASDMYKNFYSAQGEAIIGNPALSLLINKPLLRNVLHGGGLVFGSDTDPNVRKMEFWISNPMPAGDTEFDTAPGIYDPTTGACNSN